MGSEYLISRVDVDVSFYIHRAQPTIDPDETQWAVIEAGLSEGDMIVLGTADLTSGEHVRIQSRTAARAESTSTQGGE